MLKNAKQIKEDLISVQTVSNITPSELTAKIAEIAYFKAKSRGFAPGSELNDWLEAERELDLT